MNKIALSMIIKGTGKEPENLDRALQSIAPHVDGIFITITGPHGEVKKAEEVCNKYNATVSYFQPFFSPTEDDLMSLKTILGWEPHMKIGDSVFMFNEARNFNLSQISQKKYPWVVWMDCDDVFVGGEHLHELADENKGIEAWYFNYLYQVETDKEGKIRNILIQHLRERLVRNSGVYKWIAPIHETLIEQRPTNKKDSNLCEVVHLSTDEDRQASLQRNLKALELSILQTQGKDPRPIYYLAKAFFDLNTPEYNDKAISLIGKYLDGENPSGWQEERGQAWLYLCELYRRKSEINNAIKSCMNAQIEQPEDPAIYVNLGVCYMMRQDWERALYWVKRAAESPQKKTTLVSNPKDIQARILEVMYNACLNLSKLDEARAAILKLIELFPEDENMFKAYQFVEMIKQQSELTRCVEYIANFLRKTGEVHKVKALVSAIPKTVEDNPLMVNLYQQNNPPTPWGEDEIAIYCGMGFTPWSPKKLEKPGECFLGGSEEAVCYVAEALQKQGWKVTVYADPGVDEGEINGVKWVPYYKFNRNDFFNILIGWRDIRFFDGPFKAEKKYLWCHDIQNPIEYTKERVEKIDKVFFLSKWHRDNVPDLPEEKVFLTTNGIKL